MINAEVEAQILRLYQAEGWQVGEIARHLQVHHSVVRRVVDKLPQQTPQPARVRPKLIDAFMPWLLDAIEKYPTVSGRRLWEMARERGYTGRSDHFRTIIAGIRPPKRAEAYLRLMTLPGEQAQVDWGHFGTTTVGLATRKLNAFVMTLSYSRRPFVYFFYDQKLPSFLQGHVGAFEAFGGVPRVILYDNLKAVVTQRMGEAILFQPQMLDHDRVALKRTLQRLLARKTPACEVFGDRAQAQGDVEALLNEVANNLTCPQARRETIIPRRLHQHVRDLLRLRSRQFRMTRVTSTRQTTQAIYAKLLMDFEPCVDRLARDTKQNSGLFLGQVAFDEGMNRANANLILFHRAKSSGVWELHRRLLSLKVSPAFIQTYAPILYRQTFRQWGSNHFKCAVAPLN
jgi:transposase